MLDSRKKVSEAIRRTVGGVAYIVTWHLPDYTGALCQLRNESILHLVQARAIRGLKKPDPIWLGASPRPQQRKQLYLLSPRRPTTAVSNSARVWPYHTISNF